jgi:hypothetical protein
MLRLLKTLFGWSSSKPLIFEAYWCESTIKLPTKVTTPSGGSATLIKVCVDIRYVIDQDRINVRQVQLSRGGELIESNSPINVAAERRGESWYAPSICPEALLLEAVQRDLDSDGSRLRRIMMGKGQELNRRTSMESLADALNNGAEAKDIALLISTAGRGNDIAFAYTKPDGSSTLRQVSVQGISGDSLRAVDHKDGETKSFRIDRISKARAL